MRSSIRQKKAPKPKVQDLIKQNKVLTNIKTLGTGMKYSRQMDDKKQKVSKVAFTDDLMSN